MTSINTKQVVTSPLPLQSQSGEVDRFGRLNPTSSVGFQIIAGHSMIKVERSNGYLSTPLHFVYKALTCDISSSLHPSLPTSPPLFPLSSLEEEGGAREGWGIKSIYKQGEGIAMPKRANRGWQNVSTRPWRRVRAFVLGRDGYKCQLRIPGVCITHAPLTATGGVPAGHAHHTRGRSATGDNPAYLVAACEPCNLHLGDVSGYNPQHVSRTDWSKRECNDE